MSTENMSSSPALLHRVAEKSRAPVHFTINGQSATALQGDTVLTAILTQHAQLRRNEFSHEPRAGFCLMGACQDCWVLIDSGERLRACSTFITPGMALRTEAADAATFARGGQP
ncbi:(2Fe-2S)-binding protein [Acidovorax sp. sif1233]|nr:(2Fe-2S)-binding protein [Acidovorax sp. sif1233]